MKLLLSQLDCVYNISYLTTVQSFVPIFNTELPYFKGLTLKQRGNNIVVARIIKGSMIDKQGNGYQINKTRLVKYLNVYDKDNNVLIKKDHFKVY